MMAFLFMPLLSSSSSIVSLPCNIHYSVSNLNESCPTYQVYPGVFLALLTAGLQYFVRIPSDNNSDSLNNLPIIRSSCFSRPSFHRSYTININCTNALQVDMNSSNRIYVTTRRQVFSASSFGQILWFGIFPTF